MKRNQKKIKLRWDRISILIIAIILVFVIIFNLFQSNGNQEESPNTIAPASSTEANESRKPVRGDDGVYRIDDVIIVNKKYGLPATYSPGENPEAASQLKLMIAEMRRQNSGVAKNFVGYRSFQAQEKLYTQYVEENGKENADTFSARPGFSEHQTGLAFDLVDVYGELLKTKNYPKDTKWVADNAYRFGFIVRYEQTREAATGYMSEEWHVRYLGVDLAKKIYDSNKSLEEYFNIEGGNYE